jgi:hypothetical protein
MSWFTRVYQIRKVLDDADEFLDDGVAARHHPSTPSPPADRTTAFFRSGTAGLPYPAHSTYSAYNPRGILHLH